MSPFLLPHHTFPSSRVCELWCKEQAVNVGVWTGPGGDFEKWGRIVLPSANCCHTSIEPRRATLVLRRWKSWFLCEIVLTFKHWQVTKHFLKRFYYLFLERGERREKEREKNINVWLPLLRPQLGTWPITQACALTGNRTGNPLVPTPVLNPLSHTSLGRVIKIFFLIFIWKFLNIQNRTALSTPVCVLLSFHSIQLMAHLVSSCVPPTSPTSPDYFEANPRYHFILQYFSTCVSILNSHYIVTTLLTINYTPNTIKFLSWFQFFFNCLTIFSKQDLNSIHTLHGDVFLRSL